MMEKRFIAVAGKKTKFFFFDVLAENPLISVSEPLPEAVFHT